MTGDVQGGTVCEYAYAVCGLSLLTSLILSLFLVSALRVYTDLHTIAVQHTEFACVVVCSRMPSAQQLGVLGP